MKLGRSQDLSEAKLVQDLPLDPKASGFKVARLEALAYRVPIASLRKARYGQQNARAALIVRLTDRDGVVGWGECFANWPSFAAEHRVKIVSEILAPYLVDRRIDHPSQIMSELESLVAIPRIKSDEPGPFDQAIAAVDLAAWDLAARKVGRPLCSLLRNTTERSGPIKVYASGITPERVVGLAEEAMEVGISAYKLKVGFGLAVDLPALDQLQRIVGSNARLMIDADQAWSVSEAPQQIAAFAGIDLDWVEEPIRADQPLRDWVSIANNSALPIAAGENVRSVEGFSAIIRSKALGIVQPDLIKWGGFTRLLAIADHAAAYGVRLCPHYLGGGIGLMATAHFLAAIGSTEYLELDTSENPLRELLAQPFTHIRDGQLRLHDRPGLGVEPDLDMLARFRI